MQELKFFYEIKKYSKTKKITFLVCSVLNLIIH